MAGLGSTQRQRYPATADTGGSELGGPGAQGTSAWGADIPVKWVYVILDLFVKVMY